jgi:hypothetical protein
MKISQTGKEISQSNWRRLTYFYKLVFGLRLQNLYSIFKSKMLCHAYLRTPYCSTLFEHHSHTHMFNLLLKSVYTSISTVR